MKFKICKRKYYCPTLAILIILLILYKYYKISNYADIDENLIAKLKGEFGKEIYLNVKKEDGNQFVINVAKASNQIEEFIDKENQDEMERRKRFELFLKLKTSYVNNSMPKLIYSHVRNRFSSFNQRKTTWQLDVFGSSQPQIIKLINSLPLQMPEIANGYLGIQGFTDDINIQSLFSGSFMETRRASIPSWTIRNITSVFNENGDNIVIGRRLELDMSDGLLLQVLYSEFCIIQQKIYAHQKFPSLLVHEIEVQFLDSSLKYIVINTPRGTKRDMSPNIQFTEEMQTFEYIRSVVGVTHHNDQDNHQQKVYVQYHVIPEQTKVYYSKEIKMFYYILSVNENKDLSENHFKLGITQMENNNRLYAEHSATWREIWLTHAIHMRTSNKVDIPLISAQYLLMSNSPNFGRKESHGSMGATGLGVVSNQGVGYNLQTNCNGRIEYSQELWMMGYQTVVNPESVKAMLQKRIQQLPMARKNAQKLGFKGARFPAVTNELGEELCSENFCADMHFPTGMVALALRHYLMVTGDIVMFTNDTGLQLLMDINEYWLSVIKHDGFRFQKFKSSGPSLSHMHVTNSVFNVGLLKEVLLSIPMLIHNLGLKFTSNLLTYMSHLKNISDSIQLPFDHVQNYNPPFDNFNILQDKLEFPEGVMLRNPLDYLVNRDQGARNVGLYKKRLISNPSPMALSTMFIGHYEAENYQEAFEKWNELINFSNNEFKIWSNDSRVWIGSYIPAASSYINSVIFGLFGLKIRTTGLYLEPKLMRDISFMQISSISYFGSKIKVSVEKDIGITLELNSKTDNSISLAVEDVYKKRPYSLQNKLIFPLKSYLVIKRSKFL